MYSVLRAGGQKSSIVAARHDASTHPQRSPQTDRVARSNRFADDTSIPSVRHVSTSDRGLHAQEFTHVVHGERPYQRAAPDDRDGMAIMFLQDVKASRTDMTALEGINQGTAVEQGAPACVDQHDTPFHPG